MVVFLLLPVVLLLARLLQVPVLGCLPVRVFRSRSKKKHRAQWHWRQCWVSHRVDCPSRTVGLAVFA